MIAPGSLLLRLWQQAVAHPIRVTIALSLAWLPIVMITPGLFVWYLVSGWSITCLLLAAGRQAVLWTAWTLGPAALICADWILEGYPKSLDEDPFGIQFALGTGLLVVAAVTAVTGVVFLITAGAWRSTAFQGLESE